MSEHLSGAQLEALRTTTVAAIHEAERAARVSTALGEPATWYALAVQPVVAYAAARGVQGPHISRTPSLCGSGRCVDDWPLVWAVADELGIEGGAGGAEYMQLCPKIQLPEDKMQVATDSP